MVAPLIIPPCTHDAVIVVRTERRGTLSIHLLTLLIWPVLLAQALWARKRTPRLGEAVGPREGHAGEGHTLRLVALGDSIIAGVGVETTAQALPAQLAEALARRLERRMAWYSQGFNGARTGDLIAMEAALCWRDADLLVISNGLNDVTALARLSEFRTAKQTLYSRLRTIAPRALIAQVGIPPLGHFPALPQPLRFVLGQRAVAFERTLVSLIGELDHVIYLPFTDIPDASLFAADGYHPGPEAEAIWSESLAGEIAARARLLQGHYL